MNAPVLTAERRRLSADEFMAIYESGVLGERQRFRLIDGEIYALAPTGPEHAAGHGRLFAVLTRALWPRFEFADAPTLRFSDRDVAEPDVVMLTPGPRPRPPIALSEVQLIVESALTSLPDDLGVMAEIYGRAGIAEYWVLDLEHRRIIVFRKPRPHGYDERFPVEIGQTLAPLCAPDAAIAIADLF